jgi:serine/threonine protein phosphatase PrpC
VSNNNAWFAHVGDSRIYMIRDGAIKQLTEDHSLVASMVREGLLTSTEAENHPRRNVLQRSMGVGEDVEIDVSGPFPVQEGDVFILCSDGLHGLVKEAELLEIATSLPLEATANEYVRRALDRGAPDNVTVIVARIIRPDELTDDTVIDRSRDTTKKVAVTPDESPLDETQPLETLPELDQTVRVNPPPPPPRRKGLFRWLFGDSTSR